MEDAQELPILPVPQLNLTLDRYLAAVKPVVHAPQYQQTLQLVEEFRRANGLGERLQRLLEDFSKTKENWATDLWLDDMYLKNQAPLPVNSSPFFLLPKQHFGLSDDQLKFAVNILLFALSYKRKIDNYELTPDFVLSRAKRQTLCMSTYHHFFPAYRRPGEQKDELVMSTQQNGDKPLYVVVACKNQFFAVQVTRAGGEQCTEEELMELLRQVTRMATEEESSSVPIGILTAENRHTWSLLRTQLLKSSLNRSSLQIVENCLLVLCLDEFLPGPPNYTTIRKDSITLDLAAMAAHLMHGSGSEASSANRWYDKFLQVIVTKDGVVGFVIEHSASEGITVLRFCEELLSMLEKKPLDNSPCHSCKFTLPPPTALKWEVDEEVAVAIQIANKKMNKVVEDLDLFVHRFTQYGKDFIKNQKMSPDAFIQVALQLTYYKVHHRLVSTYESASLRRFRLGRVDNIRAATEEALAWIKAMCDDQQVMDEEKIKLFQACIKKQTEILFYTINGEGPDNHLMALKEMATLTGEPDPVLFRDKSYQEFLQFRLSTSQLPTASGTLVGYGPVVPDGYGCSYNPCDSHIDFCISSFFSSKETSSDFFALSLEGSLLQMREICLKIQEMKAKEH